MTAKVPVGVGLNSNTGSCMNHRYAPPKPGNTAGRPIYAWLIQSAAVWIITSILLLGVHGVAKAAIIIDGNLNEPDWNLVANKDGGPMSADPMSEINALYAKIDGTYLYLGVAGNVQSGHQLLVFIDSRSGGFNSANFGRSGAPARAASHLLTRALHLTLVSTPTMF